MTHSPPRTYSLSRTTAGDWLESRDTTRARRAEIRDLALVDDLHCAEFPATYATARHLVEDPNRFTFVVERDTVPIGYASGHLTDDGAAQLDYMAITPGARGVGDGSVLLAAAVRALFGEATVDELRLFVEEHRTPAIRFYEAHGFTRVLQEA